MTTLTDLPAEVLDLIFQQLDDQAVRNTWAAGTAVAAQWQGMSPKDGAYYCCTYQSLFNISLDLDDDDDCDEEESDHCQCGRRRCPHCSSRVKREAAEAERRDDAQWERHQQRAWWADPHNF